MSKVSSSILGAPQDLFISTVNQQADLGALMTTGDGRFFRYAQAGASALVAGTVLQSPATVSNHLQLTPAALVATENANTGAPASTSVGTNVYPVLTVTLGGTAATVNQYAGGWVVVSADGGSGGLLGPQYQIISHPAQTNGSGTLALTLGDANFNKITTSAKIDLVANPHAGVIINPASLSGTVAGVAIIPTTALYFGWVQVAGIASVLNDADGTISQGVAVTPSTTVAGAVEAISSTLQTIGIATQAILASTNGAVKLTGLL